MTENQLKQISLAEPSREISRRIKEHWDQVAKPLDSLGRFEQLTCQIGAILRDEDVDIEKKAVIVMCADHGIVAEGVSQSGSEVTEQVAVSMGKSRSSVCRMAAAAGADVLPVDIGMCCLKTPKGVLDRRVVCGTKNFAKEPAMTRGQVLDCIEVGINMVQTCREEGYRLLGIGEMGIGNTTASGAVAAALTGCDPEQAVGRGAGLDDAGLIRKKRVIREAIERYGFCPEEKADTEETLRILSCVGGADICGMAGVFIGAALYHIPVVLDGVISAAAALAAERLVPGAKEYMIPSHLSREPAAGMLMEQLGLRPIIDGDMALGEGTGAVMMFALLDAALTIYRDPTTFSDIQVERYRRYEH